MNSTMMMKLLSAILCVASSLRLPDILQNLPEEGFGTTNTINLRRGLYGYEIEEEGVPPGKRDIRHDCVFGHEDTPEKTPVYAKLFDTLSGKTLFLVGDSLMENVFFAMMCGAKLHKWYISNLEEDHDRFRGVQHWLYSNDCAESKSCIVPAGEKEDLQGKLFKLQIKRSQNAPDTTAINIYHWVCYTYSDLHDGGLKLYEGKPKPMATKWETLFDIQQQLAPDHSIFNVAHHIFGKHFDLTRMEKLAREIVDASTNRFSKLNTIWDKTVSKNRSLAFMGHPPQHFAENPENIYGGHSRGTCTKHGTVVAQNCCSNDIKNIMKQDMQVKNEVCRKVAEEYHVGWVDVFQTMVPYGNMHFPENKDCTQYKISPSSWTGTMQNVLESFQ
eukprot:gnl/MRDRNA2_/MRDRNA2_86743_c0_seq10.p1 gnl/MRDRNA2_/MRDRNA2_86743_c0~~gnl/MRDRNA2_/MRDRNA2_86743_c0_seq10.p1  ORF type:complete len:387 (-),score=58.25 gnl/MRDRNA2_/MRDRNA2_86743_c0_seq10:612-1772(-)